MKTLAIQTLLRQVSLIRRKADSAKDRRRVIQNFNRWAAAQSELPAVRHRDRTLLLIRLDDIGDYLLFRNQLSAYKKSARWTSYRITLLGNEAWRDLFTALDQPTVDDTIWINKNQYLKNAAYRLAIWKQLRAAGFESVVAPSWTRPLLLDDLCTLAAAPLHSFGSFNTNVHDCWNRLSDSCYTSLFEPSRPLMHEFDFNAEFSTWISGYRYPGNRPSIEPRPAVLGRGAYTICFVGASIGSRRWSANRWIEFIKLYRQQFSGRIIVAAGSGKSELQIVEKIQQQTGAEAITRKSLCEMLDWVAGAQAVITNNTMAAHMSASLNRPTVIVTNGINYMRFSEFKHSAITQVVAVYPELFLRRRKRLGDGPYAYHETVTADIVSIRAVTVIEALKELAPELCINKLSREYDPFLPAAS
jgi:ADP-heptose:LPS heptosyltransferase